MGSLRLLGHLQAWDHLDYWATYKHGITWTTGTLTSMGSLRLLGHLQAWDHLDYWATQNYYHCLFLNAIYLRQNLI